MRFPPKSYNKDLESAEDRREREAQDLELAKEMAEDEDDAYWNKLFIVWNMWILCRINKIIVLRAPDSRGITDWGFNIPRASVLLVINTLILPNSSWICLNTPSLYTSWQGY